MFTIRIMVLLNMNYAILTWSQYTKTVINQKQQSEKIFELRN